VETVHISRLTLADFRNYAALALELKPGPVVFTGENGAGKTNLLEAISFLTL
jgi:DNA replication and repair protein RecF